jgi:hypothetical protein
MSSTSFARSTLPMAAGTRADATAEAGRVIAAWPRVAIGAIDIQPLHEGDDRRTSVQACVHLDELLPADVRVHLVPSSGTRDAHAHRMFTAHAYGNGSYLFETSVPVSELASVEWRVEVRPDAGLAPSLDAAAVARWFAAPAHGLGVLPPSGHTLPRALP